MARQEEKKYVLRLFDIFDGWIDVTGPLSLAEATKKYNEETNQGTKMTEVIMRKKGHLCDYYKIYPANTRMIYTPEFLGR